MILYYSLYSLESLDNPVFSHVVASVMEGKITSRNTGLVTSDTGDTETEDLWISGFRFGPFMV